MSFRLNRSAKHSLTCWLQVMGLHLPEAPPPDSDEEEDPEGAAAQRSRASIPMDAGETRPPRIRGGHIWPAVSLSLARKADTKITTRAAGPHLYGCKWLGSA